MSPKATSDDRTAPGPGVYSTPPQATQAPAGERVTSESAPRYGSDSSYIKHDIDRTRSHMDRTLDELGERLRPSNLVDSVVGYFAGSSTPTATGHTDDSARRAAANVGSSAMEKVRENPLPSIAIAASLAYMFFKDDARQAVNRSRIRRNSAEPEMYGGSYVDARTGQPYDREHYGDEVSERHGRGWGGRMADYAGDKASGAAGSASHGASRAAGATASGAKSAASWIGDKISDAASSLMGTAGSAASSAASGASHLASSASHAASDSLHRGARAGSQYGREASNRASSYGRKGYAVSRDRFDDSMREHPLVVGVAALAAGVLAGLAVPRTRTEDQAFGHQSRQAKDAASDAAAEAYDRGRHIVERGINTAEEEARRQGIHPSQLKSEASNMMGRAKEAASHLADDVKRAGKEAAKDVANDAKSEADSVRGDAESRNLTPGGLADSAKSVANATKDAVAEEAEHQKEDAKREHGVES